MALPGGAGDAATGAPAPQPVVVFAAASLGDALGELGSQWSRSSGIPVKLSIAASSVLARQIEAGGAADLFVSADVQWMDYLQSRGLIEPASRRDLVGNRLVLIAPADSDARLKIRAHFPLRAALGRGRLATGDPDAVPIGRYARAALQSLGAWDAVADRLVRTDNVRAALMFVARGEVPYGIVYATDALLEPRVRVVDTFPESSHPPIVCPAALTSGAARASDSFLQFLASDEADVTWRRFGFGTLK